MTPALEGMILAALERSAGRLRPIAPPAGRWAFDLVNGRRLPGRVTWQADWLELSVPLPEQPAPELPWTLLGDNSGLRGPARFVRDGDPGMALRAEVALAGPELVPARVAAACESLRRADAVRSGQSGKRSSKVVSLPAGETEPVWERLGEERGWKLNRREDHRLAVELDAPGLMNQAFLEAREGERVISLELLRSGTLAPLCRRAIALFLLTLTGRVRGVRAVASGTEPETIRLEVVLPTQPWSTGPELELALDGLSLACRLGSRETRALAHEPLARTYLAQFTKEYGHGSDA